MSISILHPSSSLQIPLEIVEKIIKEYWSFRLSTNERISFMCNSMLVSSAWMNLYMRVSCTDIHIPNSRYAVKLINILCQRSSIYKRFAPGLHNLLSRSITFRRDFDSGPIHSSVSQISQFLTKTFQGINCLPNLQRVSFEIVDETFNSVFPFGKNLAPIRFPPHITTLEMFFAYSDPIRRDPLIMRQVLLNVDHSGLFVGCLPFVRKLTVYGASAGGMRDLILACKNMTLFDSDINQVELSKRLKLGMDIQRQQREQELAQAALDDHVNLRIEVQRIVDVGTDEEVLEAVGIDHPEQLQTTLADLEGELASSLDKEKRGDVDVLKRRFLQKGIRVCKNTIQVLQGAEKAGLVMEDIQPKHVKHDIEISPLTKPIPSSRHRSSRTKLHDGRVHQLHASTSTSTPAQIPPLPTQASRKQTLSLDDKSFGEMVLQKSIAILERAMEREKDSSDDAASHSSGSSTAVHYDLKEHTRPESRPESMKSNSNSNGIPVLRSYFSDDSDDEEGEDDDEGHATPKDDDSGSGGGDKTEETASVMTSRALSTSSTKSWIKKVVSKVGQVRRRRVRDVEV
ncbi:hypothetical protein VKT23_001195 [Stygiomarasmius scandens]|uniref:F-box domain-containing protein n=1 Tax=Marasmiellus scandens TaxID=2682957 RepID=A0ABR1K8V3_9AGAR